MKISELLTDHTKWTQHVEASNRYGKAVGATADDAECWCLLGAAVRTGNQAKLLRTFPYPDDEANRNEANRKIIAFNDANGRTFDEVKAFLIQHDL